MSNYTVTTDFSVKDALPVNDPDKLVVGADLDVEFDAIAVAIATKYDSSDIATEAQAIAGISNAVLMTPLRVAQYVGGSGAGAIGDIIALADPGADRILFWDDSVNQIDWLTVGSGLTLSGTTLTANVGAIDHDSLSGFVANEHIDHTTITITAGEGLRYTVGGTDISADSTLAVDFNGLTEEASFAVATDWIPYYDTSAAAARKVQIEDLVGTALGDGKWYRNAVQSISTTEATVVWNTASHDNLAKGTFSTSTGVYTATTAVRLLVSVNVRVEAVTGGQTIIYKVRKNTTDVCETQVPSLSTEFGASAIHANFSVVISLAAADTVDVRAAMSSGSSRNQNASEDMSNVNIVELA